MGSGLLSGIRVLDLAYKTAGSLTSALFGDWGATVFKAEALELEFDPWQYAVDDPAGRDPLFEFVNRNKMSISLAFQTKEGKEILRKVAGKVDILVTDLPTKILEDLGIDYATLCEGNPGVVYGICSGFGSRGPDKDTPPIDELACSKSGFLWVVTEPGYPPSYTANGQIAAAFYLAYGIILALYQREQSGEGQKVDASLFNAYINQMGTLVQSSLASMELTSMPSSGWQPLSRSTATNPLANLYKTKDKWVSFALAQTDRYWHDFCKAVELEDIEHDPRFNTHEKRCGDEFRQDLISILDKALLKRSAAEWQSRWEGIPLIYEIIDDFQKVEDDPQAYVNQYLIELDYGSRGKTTMIGFPIEFSRTPASISRLCPSRGEHTTKILVDVLGYSSDQITELREKKVVY